MAKVLHDHFVKEEEFALPPIGLLSVLAQGKADLEMRSVLSMTDRLKGELPDMLREHKAVVTALKKLMAAAKKENSPVGSAFPGKPETISVPTVTGIFVEDLREEMGSIFSIG